ncbi:MAG: hotdog fold domain-containing protein [Gemmatimonadaceae bacterium]
MTSNDAPGTRILSLWRRLAPLPGGRWLFNKVMGQMVPYTGALGARIESLEPGRAVVTLHDRRGVRNHLRSIHAVALANMAEFVSGTAMLTALPHGTRGIVTRLEIDYLKKARGTITGRATVTLPPIDAPTALHPEAELFDASGDLVARARVTWKVQPHRETAPSTPAAHAVR